MFRQFLREIINHPTNFSKQLSTLGLCMGSSIIIYFFFRSLLAGQDIGVRGVPVAAC
jgi:hypothetical protein